MSATTYLAGHSNPSYHDIIRPIRNVHTWFSAYFAIAWIHSLDDFFACFLWDPLLKLLMVANFFFQNQESWKKTPVIINFHMFHLSGGFWVRPAQRKVVKIKKKYFSYWASSTPWGHVLSLKTFYRNPALSWAIRYSVFQKVKFTSSLEFVCGNPFSTFWHLMVKSG